jgi:hypothetical protein
MTVIPGRDEVASPESITTAGSMDDGVMLLAEMPVADVGHEIDESAHLRR